MTRSIDTIMGLAPVIPVLVMDDPALALDVAEALVRGGLVVLEVTLRTPCALEIIQTMRQVPGAVVGAGTVLNPDDLDAALAAGAEFIVSPGLTPTLARAAQSCAVPFLPGTANAGDIMMGMDFGFRHFKFFPAQANGGIPALRAITAAIRGLAFCPTGGITPANAAAWLALEAVRCVGGSWVVTQEMLDAGDMAAIEASARHAAALPGAASVV